MSNTETTNVNTDSSNVDCDNVTELHVNVVNDDPVTDSNYMEAPENSESVQDVQKERTKYEVVFFVRYSDNPRPSSEDLTALFNNYGVVHHVNCPNEKTFAFIFMTSLNTTSEHRRTRTTITQIIRDMAPNTSFHITVANSNRTKSFGRGNRNVRKNNDEYQRTDTANSDNRGVQNNFNRNRHGRYNYNRNARQGDQQNYDDSRPRRYRSDNNQNENVERPPRARRTSGTYDMDNSYASENRRYGTRTSHRGGRGAYRGSYKPRN